MILEVMIYTLEEADPFSAAVYNQLLTQPQQMLVFLHNEGRMVTTHQFGAREAQGEKNRLIRDTFTFSSECERSAAVNDTTYLLILTQSEGTMEDMLFFTSMRN